MKTLLIVGAGGLGRETYQWVSDQEKVEKRWDVIGFLDDDPHALDNYTLSAKIIGTVKDYEPKDGDEVVCAIGDTEVIADICPVLLDKGAVFATVIHPTALLADTCQIGKGVIVGPYAIISTDAKIADFVGCEFLCQRRPRCHRRKRLCHQRLQRSDGLFSLGRGRIFGQRRPLAAECAGREKRQSRRGKHRPQKC